MAVTHSKSPVQPSEISAPYSERPSGVAGVRQSAEPVPGGAGPLVRLGRKRRPFPFAASLKTGPGARWPVASVLFTCAGQLLLAAVLAVGAVSPLVGALVAVVFLCSGLGLIFAQCVTLAGGRSLSRS